MQTNFLNIQLGEVAHIEMGQSPDSNYVFDSIDAGIPFLQGNAEFGEAYPCPRYTCTQPMKMCMAGDVLISVRAPVGEINTADRDYCIGRGLAAVRIKGITPSLAAKIIESSAFALRRVAQGTTFEAISKSDLLTLNVLIPPIAERDKLASILETLDTAIRQTEAIIAKLQQVKQGLLHDLLTCGIDANGELRPPVEKAPHLYKQSPLGWIPKEWEVEPLARQLQKITYGFTNPMPTTEQGPWMVTAADINDGRVLYEQARHTTQRDFSLLSAKSRPGIGDILVTKDGTLGRIAILEQDNVCVNQSVAVLSPKHPESTAFIATYLNSPVGQERMLADAGGSTIKHIYITKLAEMLIQWPLSVSERTEISKRISLMNSKISNEQAYLQKCMHQKSGLMDDLLTGRVRVTNLLNM